MLTKIGHKPMLYWKLSLTVFMPASNKGLIMAQESTNCVYTHPQARLRIAQPHRSCTAFGYMVDSLDVFVTPQKNRPPTYITYIRQTFNPKSNEA